MTPRRDFVPQKGNRTPTDDMTPYTKTPQASGREWGQGPQTPRADDPDRIFGRDDRGWDAPPDEDNKNRRRKEKVCRKCGKEGHFARECKTRD
mmetsp:Transcript_13557/g.2144  ORF Transcript_13557/g.2144 Transcript_13557/m.2144 type:complete len:93 (-) Transcript_13557:151-429(-)